MKVGNDCHLTYCTNIHAGETWPAIRDILAASLPRIRTLLDFTGPLAVGLRLSAAAAATLESPDELSAFCAFLADGDYYVPTINGFPYGAFHGQRVKENVYLPDWRDPARLEYSNRLARLLAHLLSGRQDIEGSVSTVPGAFGSSVRGDADVKAIAANILRHAAHLVSLRRRTGTAVTLALEPEPACFIETIDDATTFFTRVLFDEALVAAVSRELDVPLTVDEVRRHVGVCLDACHMAVEFEDAGEALEKLRLAGVRICKVQISSALQLDHRTAAELNAALAPFAEDTYLHQVVERTGAGLSRYVDLPDALAAVSAAASADGAGPRDWRVHFHVPIFIQAMQHLETTQPYLVSLLQLLKREGFNGCLEVETYTWDVLPEAYRTVDVCTAIAREIAWARTQILS